MIIFAFYVDRKRSAPPRFFGKAYFKIVRSLVLYSDWRVAGNRRVDDAPEQSDPCRLGSKKFWDSENFGRVEVVLVELILPHGPWVMLRNRLFQ